MYVDGKRGWQDTKSKAPEEENSPSCPPQALVLSGVLEERTEDDNLSPFAVCTVCASQGDPTLESRATQQREAATLVADFAVKSNDRQVHLKHWPSKGADLQRLLKGGG